MNLPRSRFEPILAIRYLVEKQREAGVESGGQGDWGHACGHRLPTLRCKQMFKEQ